jgi:hypothetical protein
MLHATKTGTRHSSFAADEGTYKASLKFEKQILNFGKKLKIVVMAKIWRIELIC